MGDSVYIKEKWRFGIEKAFGSKQCLWSKALMETLCWNRFTLGSLGKAKLHSRQDLLGLRFLKYGQLDLEKLDESALYSKTFYPLPC